MPLELPLCASPCMYPCSSFCKKFTFMSNVREVAIYAQKSFVRIYNPDSGEPSQSVLAEWSAVAERMWHKGILQPNPTQQDLAPIINIFETDVVANIKKDPNCNKEHCPLIDIKVGGIFNTGLFSSD